MSQNTVTSHFALFTWILIDSDISFGFLTLCLSLSVYGFVFLYCVRTSTVISAVFVSGCFLFVCFSGYIIIISPSLLFSHSKQDNIDEDARKHQHTKMIMHTHK